MHEIELNNVIKKVAKIKINLEQIVGSTTTYLIYFLTIIMALNQIGLTTTMLSGAVLVIIVLSIFLSIKDSIPNIMAGISIIRKEDIKEGDFIKTKEVSGKVKNVTLTEIQLKTRKDDIIHIPNSIFVKTEYSIRRSKSK